MIHLPRPRRSGRGGLPALALALLLTLPLAATRTVDTFLCKTWTQEEGLPMNSILAIAQTPDGYLWLGTETGLARFDGLRFELFNRDNVPELAIDFIIALLVDRQGTLWIGTRGGGMLRYREGRFAGVTAQPACNEAWKFLETRDGAVWIGCRGGLFRYVAGRLQEIPLPGSASSRYVRSLAEDRDGRVWAGTRGGGLFALGRQGDRWEAEEKGCSDLILDCLFVDRDGALWGGTEGAGAIRIQGDRVTRITGRDGLTGNSVRCFFQERSGDLWIGTAGGGICVYDPRRDRITPFDPHDEMNSHVIYALFQDQENNIWAGTNGNGLIKLREAVIQTYTSRQGLSGDVAFSVFQDSRRTVWVGTMGSGVNYLNGDRFLTMTRHSGLSDDSVISIGECPPGCLWFGTPKGLDRYENRLVRTYTKENGLSDNIIRALYTDRSGVLWIGLANGDVFGWKDERFFRLGNVEYRVNTIHRDRRGDLWVGSFGSGLNRFRNGRRQVFDKARGLPGNCVLCISEDAEGGLWIGTYRDGLAYFRDGRFTCMSKREGLSDDTIYCLIEDFRHDLWMSTNRGVMRIAHRDLVEFLAGRSRRLTPAVFGRDHGMRSMECNGGLQPSGLRSGDGRLWFPTTKGVAVIDPRHTHTSCIPPPVQIERVTFDDRALTGRDEIVVPPGRGNLEVSFTAPTFCMPDKVHFHYRLEGYDPDWIDGGAQRQARYTGLGPGRYTFRVRAASNEGVWNSEGASLRFRWQPHVYETWLFRLGVPLLLAGMLLLLRRGRRRLDEIRRRRRKLNRSAPPPEEVERCLQRLLYLMEEEKIFLHPNLTLKMLAGKLLISPRYLSEIINERLKKNFFELVNHYRIREAKRILAAPGGSRQSILELSYQIGFNSKSAFNRAFKTHTRMTPSEFIRSSRQPD